MARRMIRVPLSGSILSSGGTQRVAVVCDDAQTVISVGSYSLTTDNAKPDDKKGTITIQRGTTPATLGTAATLGQLEPTTAAGFTVYGTGCDAPGSPTTLATPYFNSNSPYGNTLGLVLTNGQAVTFAITWPSGSTNAIAWCLEIFVETV